MLGGVARERGFVDVAGATLAVETGQAPGATVTLGIRPEAFQVSERSGSGVLGGRVRLVEHLGSDLFAHLDMPGIDEPVIARLLAERAPDIHIGETVHLTVRPERVLLFDDGGHRLRPEGSNITALRSRA
jgi:multiple sugar transport system ATP-binding protein